MATNTERKLSFFGLILCTCLRIRTKILCRNLGNYERRMRRSGESWSTLHPSERPIKLHHPLLLISPTSEDAPTPPPAISYLNIQDRQGGQDVVPPHFHCLQHCLLVVILPGEALKFCKLYNQMCLSSKMAASNFSKELFPLIWCFQSDKIFDWNDHKLIGERHWG